MASAPWLDAPPPPGRTPRDPCMCWCSCCEEALTSTLTSAIFFPAEELLLFYKLRPHSHVQSDARLNYKVLHISPSIWLHFSSMFSYNAANTISQRKRMTLSARRLHPSTFICNQQFLPTQERCCPPNSCADNAMGAKMKRVSMPRVWCRMK